MEAAQRSGNQAMTEYMRPMSMKWTQGPEEKGGRAAVSVRRERL
jgi:hypothetical protein